MAFNLLAINKFYQQIFIIHHSRNLLNKWVAGDVSCSQHGLIYLSKLNCRLFIKNFIKE